LIEQTAVSGSANARGGDPFFVDTGNRELIASRSKTPVPGIVTVIALSTTATWMAKLSSSLCVRSLSLTRPDNPDRSVFNRCNLPNGVVGRGESNCLSFSLDSESNGLCDCLKLSFNLENVLSKIG
jgi:hypothetical protein